MTEPGGRARPRYQVTFALLALAGVAYALLQSLVAPALPDIQHSLHTTVNGVSWVLTAYLLSASIATPVIGRLGDMYGKERLLVVVLVLLCVATTVSALATSLSVMLVGRVVQGAAGGIFPLAFGIIRDEFPRERVAGAVGIMSALLGVGGGAGVVLAGPIVQGLSIHWLFWFPLVVAGAGDDRRASVRARVARARARPRELARRRADVRWTRGRAPRRQRGAGLALVVGADARRVRDRRRRSWWPGCETRRAATTRSSTCG